MKRLSSILIFGIFLLSAPFALATFAVGELDSQHADPRLGTHVVISGQGLEAGTTWLNAAHTQALVFKDLRSHGRILLIAAVAPEKPDVYLGKIRDWGYENVRYEERDFNSDRLIALLSQIPLIASIDFVGHDGAFLGLALQDEDSNHRFYLSDVDRLAGKVRFTKDAYVRLMGCNTGWYLAPYIARKLGVPAAGTLTSADVEVLATDQNWYYDDAGLFPPGQEEASENRVSYSDRVPCVTHGGCVRLKAINGSYTGQHGVYAGSVPFLKFFCGSVAQSDCERRMALSTRTLVGVHADFATILADQFCPPSLNADNRRQCLQQVSGFVNGKSGLDPFFTTLPDAGTALTCSFTGCLFKAVKDSSGQTVLVSTGPSKSSVFVDELNAYRRGFQSLSF